MTLVIYKIKWLLICFLFLSLKSVVNEVSELKRKRETKRREKYNKNEELMNGCERVSSASPPLPLLPLFPSAVYDIVMNLRLTQPPPLPKHVTTQMNNKRSCYQEEEEEEYNERVHLLTLPSPPFLCCTSLLFSSRLFSSPPVLCCPVSFV